MGTAAVDIFGKYELSRRLAFGGMAEIFLAALKGEQGFAKKVVLKRILPQYNGDPEFVQMFIDEAVIAARLTHSNIVQVYDFGEVDGVYFIAMEWVDGIDLRTLTRATNESKRGLEFVEVAAIGEGICRGLGYAHNFAADDGRPLNIVHRDISPHNVMLSRSGEPKVMDFGIAKAEERATRTKTGMIKGKIAYMAPEQAGGHPIDKRSDQFAVGLVLWECITGTRLFTGDSDMEMLRKVVSCETRPPSALRERIPPQLDRIVMRALSPSADDRYPDLSDMERELATFRFSFGAEGAVQLGALVDEVSPRQPTAKTGQKGRQTRPLSEEVPAVAPAGTSSAPADRPLVPTELVARPGGGDDVPVASEGWEGGTQLEAEAVSDDWSDGADLPTAMTASQSSYDRNGGPGSGAPDPAAGAVLQAVEPVAASRRTWILAAVALGLAILTGIATLVLPRVMDRGTQEVPVEVVSPAEAPPVTGTLTIRSEPPGAAIAIQGIAVGLKTPAPIPSQPVGQPLQIELTLGGFEVHREIVTLSDVQHEHAVVLVPLAGETVFAAAPPGPSAAPSAPTVGEPGPTPAPEAASLAPAKKPLKANKSSSRQPAAPAGEPGMLSLRTKGEWVEVYLGKKKLGNTPLNGIEIPAGKHKLRLVNRDIGFKKTLKVTVAPGAHVKETVAVE